MEASAFSTLLYEVDDDGVATVTLNRPEALNALNQRTVADLHAAFRQARTDTAVRGVILTGAGDRAFAAGADISEFAEMDALEGQRFAQRGQAIFTSIEAMPKPVVAAVNGFALGGGCELAMACHLRVASDKAQFGQPEVNLGLIPGYGGTQRLPRLVGFGVAAELLLTGERITAQRAYEVGLVNRVATPEALLDVAKELLLQITAKAPAAVAMALQALRAADLPLAAGLAQEAALFGQCCATDDFAEGVMAFLDRRKPEFTGR
ncbi:MAG TPA: enoyl-CoA hydratase-related protein [Rubricoccaceae bacterium]|nr:enoyl-CoA hydratase-related protein [Rubricoccaceae bacterium]